MKKRILPITLGRLIKLLEVQDPGDALRFDFCVCVPTSIGSYRGYYEQLAIGWREHVTGEYPTVKEWLKILRKAVGKSFHGYKGSSKYKMHPRTWVWVANPGRYTRTAVTGIIACKWETILQTAFIDLDTPYTRRKK